MRSVVALMELIHMTFTRTPFYGTAGQYVREPGGAMVECSMREHSCPSAPGHSRARAGSRTRSTRPRKRDRTAASATIGRADLHARGDASLRWRNALSTSRDRAGCDAGAVARAAGRRLSRHSGRMGSRARCIPGVVARTSAGVRCRRLHETIRTFTTRSRDPRRGSTTRPIACRAPDRTRSR